MAKEVIQIIKLQLPAGKANPVPPVGPDYEIGRASCRERV